MEDKRIEMRLVSSHKSFYSDFEQPLDLQN